MDSALRRQRITTLTAQVEFCRIECSTLEGQLSQPGLAPDKRIELFRHIDQLMRDRKAALKKLAELELAEQVSNAR